jgi:hypothetical protein
MIEKINALSSAGYLDHTDLLMRNLKEIDHIAKSIRVALFAYFSSKYKQSDGISLILSGLKTCQQKEENAFRNILSSMKKPST